MSLFSYETRSDQTNHNAIFVWQKKKALWLCWRCHRLLHVWDLSLISLGSKWRFIKSFKFLNCCPINEKELMLPKSKALIRKNVHHFWINEFFILTQCKSHRFIYQTYWWQVMVFLHSWNVPFRGCNYQTDTINFPETVMSWVSSKSIFFIFDAEILCISPVNKASRGRKLIWMHNVLLLQTFKDLQIGSHYVWKENVTIISLSKQSFECKTNKPRRHNIRGIMGREDYVLLTSLI